MLELTIHWPSEWPAAPAAPGRAPSSYETRASGIRPWGRQLRLKSLHTCRAGELGVEFGRFWSSSANPGKEMRAGGVMKTSAFFAYLGLVLSFAVLQQTTYHKAIAATGVRPSEATARGNGNASLQNACIQQCAQARDNCRTQACVSVGGQPDTAQACSNVPPQRAQELNQKVQGCFDQEKACDKGCPTN
jgi:hypothetical protein